MFTEGPFIQRYQMAADAGFKAVESGFPYGLSLDTVLQSKTRADVEQVLINIYTGDTTKGEIGFAAVPGKEKEFRNSLDITVEYAKALGAKKMHIMSGKVENPIENYDETLEQNLHYAVQILEKENIMGLLEPINKYSVPYYYMNSFEKAVAVIDKINSPNLKLMLDVFHLQQICGDISHKIENLMKYVGHVQVAQVPNRNEPHMCGELDYKYNINHKQQHWKD
ncbi:hypothetical protein FQA39_LY00301 [Lamprigera yunnana]|nr:hypothetical protein FQA39_LY00301 [Lamprigera yunnana]